MYPKVLTVALRMAFLWALRSSSSSKQMRIHSLADTYSAPLHRQTRVGVTTWFRKHLLYHIYTRVTYCNLLVNVCVKDWTVLVNVCMCV